MPRDKPPFLMHTRRWFVFLPLLIIVADRAAEPWMPYVWRVHRLHVVVFALACVFLAALLHAIRMRRHLRSIDYAACLECGYELKGLPAEHLCPECGRPFRLPAVRATWQYFSRWR